MTYEVPVNDPVAQSLLSQHDAAFQGAHTNLHVGQCACRIINPSMPSPEPMMGYTPAPVRAVGADGGICFACGGLTVRTGSCTTCTQCGTSSGCG